jgi:hypothetical protein
MIHPLNWHGEQTYLLTFDTCSNNGKLVGLKNITTGKPLYTLSLVETDEVDYKSLYAAYGL